MRTGRDKRINGRVILSAREKKKCCKIMADILPSMRKTLSLTQTEFGELCGLSRARLSLIERGEVPMSWTQLTSVLLILMFNAPTLDKLWTERPFPLKLFRFIERKKKTEEPEICIEISGQEKKLRAVDTGEENRAYSEWKPIDYESAATMSAEELLLYMPDIFREHVARVAQLDALLLKLAFEAGLVSESDGINKSDIALISEAHKYVNIGMCFLSMKTWDFDSTNRTLSDIWMRHIGDGCDVLKREEESLPDTKENARRRRIMQLAGDAALSHHERWDGYGSPNEIAGKNINIGGRIYAICFSYNRTVSGLFNTPPMPYEFALTELERFAGRVYDPDLVELFVRNIELFNECQAAARPALVE